ncbi:peptidylprolyl isomerase [Flavobacterium sp. HSC-61S13]|uniref:peptidylprolyl isomerase n=1 Tax=Flavobacterium sp. HSC-61S13 TaxID=2910963 RepID=UPI0020A0EEE7|nr:peptidylprolyl isomerase [Flavobacterium sp. HSC-61S13]MCP1996887.1 peptidyl-prolyl cis-trans isomerase D [Flavobacterium sp. HSC-61S13]
MAVLSKIRQKSVLLIAVVGIALLAFVVGDLVRGGGVGKGSRNVGSINGVEINTQQFMQKVTQAEQSGQAVGAQANNMVWNNEVNSVLLGTEFEKIGLKIGKDQLVNVIKTNPNFANNPQFQNQLGKFDINKFNEFIVTMKKGGAEQWNSWLAYEKELEKFALEQMYFSMIRSGLNTTTAEAKNTYQVENSKATFDYVTVPYSSINDDQVKVTDAEIQTYLKKNEKQYKSEPTRDIEYVFVSSLPSEKDKAEVKENISELLKSSIVYNNETKKNDTVAGFKNTSNLKEFVNLNSDVKFDSLFYSKSDLPLEYQEELFNLQPGEVFGPYLFNDHYCLTRLVDKKPGEKVKAAHILISFAGSSSPMPGITRTKEEAKAKADELLKQALANPAQFGALAMENSEDPGSKNNAGEYDNIARGQMVKPFDEFVFSNAPGKIGVVETDFGYHVIKVLEKKDAIRLATIARKVEVSEATADQIYTTATKFEQDVATKDFEALAKQMNLPIQPSTTVRPFDEQLPLVGKQRSIVTWAFNKATKVGDIKKFDNADGHVIVKVKSANETGLLSIEEARATVAPILMNEKKAALIRPKMEGKTLAEVSAKTGATLTTATDVSRQNPLIINVGPEPKVVGNAFALKAGAQSSLIDGNKGVYIIQTKSVNLAPDLPSYNNYKTKTTTTIRGTAQSKVMEALKNNAKIEDHRMDVM